MSRPLRIAYEGAVYHVMNRGLNRQKIFYNNQDYQKFIGILKDSVSMWSCQIHAVSLLPNHYHILLETPCANISRVMRHIGAVYTQWFNQQHHRDGPVFRGRFKAILVDEDAYLVELLRYIHLNPFKAKIVKHAQDHRWTSYQAYLRTLKNWQWLATERLLDFFGKDIKTARAELKKFTEAGIPKELDERLSSKNWPSVFSSKNFEQLINWNFVKDLKNREVCYKPYKSFSLSIQSLKQIITECLDCHWSDLKDPKGKTLRQKRCMALAVIQNELRLPHKKIVVDFGALSPSTVTRASQKAQTINPVLWEYLVKSVQNAKSKI